MTKEEIRLIVKKILEEHEGEDFSQLLEVIKEEIDKLKGE